MPVDRVEFLIESLDLKPHPEGGFFKETYRSEGVIDPRNWDEKYDGRRNFSTGIYYLLNGSAFSAFHRIHQDEMWHFYEGGTVVIHELSPSGEYNKTNLGSDIESGALFQYVVKGGNYFAVELLDKKSYALCGCTVAPGFDFADFQMPDRHELLDMFPQHLELISRLTRV